MEHEIKRLESFEIKDAGSGMVEAVVATLNVVDLDRDVILPGAIRDGMRVKISHYDHSVIVMSEPPVGKGTLSVQGDKLVLTGQYFLGTGKGRDAFEMVKALGPDSQWSIGYNNVKAGELGTWRDRGARRVIESLEIIEASPVLIGAGIDTQTLATKNADEDAERVAQEQAEAERKADLDRQAQDALSQEIARKALEQLEQFERTRRKLEMVLR